MPGQDAPKYKTIKLSQLLDNPAKYLLPKTSAKITLDIDISYEEANFIKDTFVDTYDLRDITLVPVKNTEHRRCSVLKFISKLLTKLLLHNCQH